MDIRDYLNQHGGVARTGQLLAAGYTRTDLARLTVAGVQQPRRGIFMLPDCKPEIAAAIRHNARVTSRASMLRDLNRNNASTVNGYAVLRYMPEVIWFEPDRVIYEIQAVLRRRRAHP